MVELSIYLWTASPFFIFIEPIRANCTKGSSICLGLLAAHVSLIILRNLRWTKCDGFYTYNFIHEKL